MIPKNVCLQLQAFKSSSLSMYSEDNLFVHQSQFILQRYVIIYQNTIMGYDVLVLITHYHFILFYFELLIQINFNALLSRLFTLLQALLLP
jgi:hypothetical protein